MNDISLNDETIDLIVQNHSRLFSLNSTHKLLRYIEPTNGGFRYVPSERDEFRREFGADQEALISYILALDSAIAQKADTRVVQRPTRFDDLI